VILWAGISGFVCLLAKPRNTLRAPIGTLTQKETVMGTKRGIPRHLPKIALRESEASLRALAGRL
jgi:hypothetical protein